MNVLIDTSVWSLALRRQPHNLSEIQRHAVKEWRRLIEDSRVVIAGPIRQEILSGIRVKEQFQRIQEQLGGFDSLSLSNYDFDQAAIFYNYVRSKGVAGGSIDLLICAIAYRHQLAIFTTDQDFNRYAQHLPIQLHEIGTAI